MTGAVLALLGAGSGAGAGVTTPGALSWFDIYATIVGVTNNQTLTLITVPISITAAKTGAGTLYWIKNGAAPVAYTGAFSVGAGDTLAWQMMGGSVSGVVTVTNATTATTLTTFNYTLLPFRLF